MKLIGIETESQRLVAVPDGDTARPLAPIEEFWTKPDVFVAAGPTGTAVPRDRYRLVPPVREAARVICIGLNYRAHAAEGGFTPPEFPTVFGRWTASLSVGDATVAVPIGEPGLDWEAEVAAYLGSSVRDADEAEAAEAVFGYSTFNDLTARVAQKLTAQWTLGKNGDASGPLGPLVTRDEVGDLRDGLRVVARVNGATVQDGNTRDMIFTVPRLISLISRTFTLHAGDLIATGTPEGVGYVRTPPWLLHDGDVVEVEIDRLGTLTTPVGPRAGA